MISELTSTVQGYLDHLTNHKRVTPSTLRNYRSTCADFAHWASENGHALDSDTIQAYCARYEHAASANTARVRLVGLAKFAKVDVEVVRAKEPVREVEALSSDEVEALLRESRVLDAGVSPAVVFLSQTGLRFDEFMRASTEDVMSKRGSKFLRVDGKGRKRRIVPLTPEAYKALKALPERNAYFEKVLRRHLTRAGKRAKLPFHSHPHLLRASFISIHLNERGTQAIMLAKVVGHSSVDTMLKHYYKADLNALAAIM